jgi:hypothetical protein
MTIGLAVVGAAVLGSGAAGVAGAWWMRRRTRLSPWNAYLAWLVCVALTVTAAGTRELLLFCGALTVLVGATIAAVLGHRWRVTALGAGGELREHERARVMAWTAIRARRRRPSGARRGERVYLAGQGELVRERDWPEHVRALPMTGDGRALLPLEEGHHQLFVGATGSGKRTSARRVLLARGLSAGTVALIALDPKGDPSIKRERRPRRSYRTRVHIRVR